ncbi:MAG: hypothetical protein P3B76_01565 [Gemmatimonadota bacterium]|nr:hypothetical protein [Gemmatimonadota bacterium]MDQ8171350.1 hypothetical protein [Gemmatimonadota bacterium]
MSTSDFTARRSAEVPVMVAPYASPLSTDARSARDGTGVSGKTGPYIPAPWRGRPSLDRQVAPPLVDRADAEFRSPPDLALGRADFETARPQGIPVAPAMPWIDAFLASTPAMPMRAIASPTPLAEPTIAPSVTSALSDTGFAEPLATTWATPLSIAAAEFPADDWPLDDAAQELEALAHDLYAHEATARRGLEPDGLFETAGPPEFLPAWSDDDLIDIMPRASARASGEASPLQTGHSAASLAPESSARRTDIEPWADRARRSGDEGAEAAARALELLARRVRDGELSLTGYEPRLGDAAVLAAALAALLGARPS